MVVINVNRAKAEAGAKSQQWLPPENTQVLCEITNVDATKLEEGVYPHIQFAFKIVAGQPDAGNTWYATVFIRAYKQDCASKPLVDLLDVFFGAPPDGQPVELDAPVLMKRLLTERIIVILGKHRKKDDFLNAQINGFASPAAATQAVSPAVLGAPAQVPIPPPAVAPPPSEDDIPF